MALLSGLIAPSNILTATQVNTLLSTKEDTSSKNALNGYAGLDAGGKVSSAQLPSYVDDVLEYTTLGVFPVTGESGKIYVDLATNKAYRWSGSAYVEIGGGAVTSVGGFSGAVSAANLLTSLKTVDGASSDLDADLLDGQQGSYYLDWGNVSNKPDPVITVTLTGDVTGTANATLTDLASGTVSVATTIAANSVALGADTTGNYVATIAGTANQVTVTGSDSETATVTLSLPQDLATNSAVTFGAATILTGTGRIGLGTDGGGSLSIGRIDGVASLPYFDFNSGATLTDFDVRIQASGGNGTAGNGVLTFSASELRVGVNKVWHEGNDGAVSGLDADMVDGKHVGTSGDVIPTLNGANTWGNNQVFSVSSAGAALALTNSGAGPAMTANKQIVSSLAIGTSPFSITSTTVNVNLNADLLDGQQGSYYQDAANINAGTLADARLPTSMAGKTFTTGISTPGITLSGVGLAVPTQAEVEDGTATTARLITAERLKQAILANAAGVQYDFSGGSASTVSWDMSINCGASV